MVRWRLRAGRPTDPCTVDVVTGALRDVLADASIWEIHTEHEILEQYRRRGLSVHTLEDVQSMVALRDADRLALIGARPVGVVRQLRNRRRFRGELAEEIVALVREASVSLVHNAAVYGYRAGSPGERALAVWILAAAVRATPDDWTDALDRSDGETPDVSRLAYGLARAKSGAGPLTGVRPIFGDFNAWLLTQTARNSYWTYRERLVRSRAGDAHV